MRKLMTMAAAGLAAAIVFLLLTRPAAVLPASGVFDDALMARTIPGAYHVHSDLSDGAKGRDEIAAAAARAGLRFVVFTDHGDGTRPAGSPRYVHGVLCIDGVEISSDGGHYVALDMRSAPYPLGGEAAAVIEDVRRLGGFGVVAHPFSMREELRWTDWNGLFDGIEWLNADSEWRDERWTRLVRLPFDYLVAPSGALASMLDRPALALTRWDDLTSRRPVVALAAHDAHGGLSGRSEQGPGLPLPGLPSYEASFRAFSIRAIVATPLTGAAPEDARLVLNAIRRGRVYSAVDALAAPAQLAFTATTGSASAQMGDALPFEPGIELLARATLPAGGRLLLICDGREAGQSESGELRIRPEGPSACRPEVAVPGAPGHPPVPWIVGNPIHLLAAVAEPVGSEPLFESVLSLLHADWVVEKDEASSATRKTAGTGVRVDFQLRPGERVSQYVAAVASLAPPIPPYDRILFTADASRPMRVSVQLRFATGERWVHSVFVEPDARRVAVPLSLLVRAGGAAPRPDFRQATSILFVVDLTNAAPGASGSFGIADLAFARAISSR